MFSRFRVSLCVTDRRAGKTRNAVYYNGRVFTSLGMWFSLSVVVPHTVSVITIIKVV